MSPWGDWLYVIILGYIFIPVLKIQWICRQQACDKKVIETILFMI